MNISPGQLQWPIEVAGRVRGRWHTHVQHMETMAKDSIMPAVPTIQVSRRNRMTPRMFCRQGRYTPIKVPIWGLCGEGGGAHKNTFICKLIKEGESMQFVAQNIDRSQGHLIPLISVTIPMSGWNDHPHNQEQIPEKVCSDLTSHSLNPAPFIANLAFYFSAVVVWVSSS